MTSITGLGLAVPGHRLPAEEGRQVMSAHWPRLSAMNMEPVDRFLVTPVDELFQPRSLGSRMRQYEVEAPLLAELAVTRALAAAGTEPTDVDVVISVSCTGYMVPSLEVTLGRRIGLRPDVVRVPLTELGCSGGAAALSLAHRCLLARPGDVVLVVCVELCSLTFDPEDHSLDNLTASLVFGDGAAAAILTGRAPGLELTATRTHLFRDTEGLLGFRLTDSGFQPVLDRRLAVVLERGIGQVVSQFREGPLDFYAVHAGGPRIFEAVERALCLGPDALSQSRKVFREYGNLSSASILFVLSALADRTGHGLALAFGPGLTLEMLALVGGGV